jgi:hypothetical protein
MRQTRDEPGSDRVSRRCENDGDGRRSLLRRQDDGGARCDDHIDIAPDELGRDVGSAIRATLRPSVLDCDVATINPAKFSKALHESIDPSPVG